MGSSIFDATSVKHDIMDAPMNEDDPVADATPPGGDARRTLRTEEFLLGGLAVLSMVGIAIADFSANFSFRYWIAMVPVFAGVSLFAGWSRARTRGQSVAAILRAQLLHWSVMPVAVYLVYLLQSTGRLNREDAGLVALLSLALTTFLAGVHFDWRLSVIGVVMAAGAILAALVEEFFWIFLLLALPVIAVLVWRKRSAGRDGSKDTPGPPAAAPG
jgi:hypothetical protein